MAENSRQPPAASGQPSSVSRQSSAAGRRPSTIKIEVAYALPERQALIALEVEEGATVGQAIGRSGILSNFPEIELARERLGVFGKRVEINTPLRDGDRVEIYRPLVADPKQVRRERAERRARAKPR